MADTIQPVYHAFDLGFDTEDIKRIAIQQDADKTHILVITVYTNDDQMELNPAWEYHITMRKPDGKLVVDTSNIEIRDDKIYVTCTAQMLSAPGTSKCQLVIYNNSQSIYTNYFYIYVDPDLITGDEIESTNEFNSIVDVLRLIQQYEQLALTSKNNAAQSESQAATSADNAEDYEIQIKAILDSLDGYDEQITALINLLNTKMAEIDALKTQIQDSSDEIETLLKKIENMGLDQLQDILNNSLSIYSNLQTLNSNCETIATNLQTTASTAETMAGQIETKLNTVNSQYETFETQYDDFEEKYGDIQSFLADVDEIMQQIQDDRDAIARNKQQSIDDAAAISDMKDQIEDLLEQLERQVAQGGALFDPIIISSDRPLADAQTTDDMWLQPYSE